MAKDAEKNQRRILFVDARIQGALMLRVAVYWVCCVVTSTVVILAWSVLRTPPGESSMHQIDGLWQLFSPGVVAALVVLPLAVYDLVRVSNRFVGPIIRLRGAMKRLGRGEDVAPLSFRSDDFWGDLTEAFNATVDRVHRAEQSGARDGDADELVGVGAGPGTDAR